MCMEQFQEHPKCQVILGSKSSAFEGMSEAEWGESWDDWDGGGDEYTFGPNGEFIDMSTMDVGLWSDLFDNETASASASSAPPPPPPPPRASTLPPQHMANESHFVARIIRHYRYIAVLDAVKSRLNLYYEDPPEGHDSAYFLDEMKRWKEFAEVADKMKGDLRITGQTEGRVAYLDGIQGQFGHMATKDFEKMIKHHDEQVVRDITTCIDHYIAFFEDLPTNFTRPIRLDYVLQAVQPVSAILTPFDKDAPRRFSRAGGLESGFGLKYRIRNDSRVRKHLEKVGVDLTEMGYGPYFPHLK